MTTELVWIILGVLCWDAALIIPHQRAEAMPQEVIFPDQLPSGSPYSQQKGQRLVQQGPINQHGLHKAVQQAVLLAHVQQGSQQHQGPQQQKGPQQQQGPQQQPASKVNTCSGAELVTNRNLPGITAEGCDLLQGHVMWPGDPSQCAQLHSQGPCNPGFWVTLSNDITRESTCGRRNCPNGEVVMGGQCYRVDDPNICPPTMTLQANEFGNSECECPSGTIYYHLTEKCYPPYTQGPCQSGYIIKVINFADRGESQCVINLCPSQNMVPLDQQCLVVDRSLVPSQCHTINTEGPCSNGRISIDNSLAEPGCADTDSDRSIVNIPCRRGSRRDHRGLCRRIFRSGNQFRRPQPRPRPRPHPQNLGNRPQQCTDNQMLLGDRCTDLG